MVIAICMGMIDKWIHFGRAVDRSILQAVWHLSRVIRSHTLSFSSMYFCLIFFVRQIHCFGSSGRTSRNSWAAKKQQYISSSSMGHFTSFKQVHSTSANLTNQHFWPFHKASSRQYGVSTEHLTGNNLQYDYRISSIFSITLNIRSPSIFSKIIIFCASKIRSQDFK